MVSRRNCNERERREKNNWKGDEYKGKDEERKVRKVKDEEEKH